MNEPRKTKIALGSDHAGLVVKNALLEYLTKDGYKVADLGTYSAESTDYPDYAVKVAKAVQTGRCDRGLLVCGTGNGMAMTANKIPGVRAALAWSTATAKLVSEHNWSNVLCIPGRFVTIKEAKKILQTWLATPYDRGGRHERRVKKIMRLDCRS
jgi:ribose 5-phosphate isomerase B